MRSSARCCGWPHAKLRPMANVVIKDRRGGNPRSAAALQNAILNSAVISCIATDERGVIRILSAGAERMLGYTEAEVAGKRTPADFYDPLQAVERARALSLEFATAVDPGFQALVFKASRGIEDQYELTWIRKDGSRLPAVVSVIALGDPKGEVIGYLMVTTDNTAQETFRLMVESVTDCGIVQLDAQGRVLSWNAGAQIIDGYGAQEIVGQHFSRFYSAQDVELGVPQRDLDAAAATGRHETEGWRSRKDGSMYRANIVLTSIHDQAGVLRGFARLTRDVARDTRIGEPQQSAIESPEPAGEPAPQPRPASGAARRSLLYVEDHPASLGMVEQLVARRTDMLLLRAANVRLGIELARTARPEVILLNIDLPGTGALQFMKLLRADPATQDTPLLALGAHAAPVAIKNALEAGFFHYLTKPLEPERFTQALDDALEFAALERAEQDDRAFAWAHSH
jgi:PAS domain S-box-containing protein